MGGMEVIFLMANQEENFNLNSRFLLKLDALLMGWLLLIWEYKSTPGLGLGEGGQGLTDVPYINLVLTVSSRFSTWLIRLTTRPWCSS